MDELKELERAREELRKVRDRFKSSKSGQVKAIGKMLNLFIMASYDEGEVDYICELFEEYFDDLLGGPN